MRIITKLKVKNYKRFENTELVFNDDLNIIVGDNESGKSSILQAIDIVISGSRTKVDTIGLESLFNANIIDAFMSGDKKYKDLPELFIELYLNEQNNFKLNGQNNSDGIICDGLSLICKPNDDFSEEIVEILNQDHVCFPFEYYTISFQTFSGQSYTGYRRFLKKIFIDNSAINNEYAAREYIKDVYAKHVETVVLLSQQKADDHIEVDLDLDEMDATSAETKATYSEMKDYILEKHGLKVSNLYISQVKRKFGIEVGENYNLPKSEDARQPQCPREKEKAIRESLKHFGMDGL